MKLTLYRKDWKVYPILGIDSDEKIDSYIEWMLHFDLKKGLRFSTSVPNHTCCTRSSFKCLFSIFKHSVTQQIQYDVLENKVQKEGYWQKL